MHVQSCIIHTLMVQHSSGKQPFILQETDAIGKQKAQERFQRIKTAYEVLKDPQMRRDYDSGTMAATG